MRRQCARALAQHVLTPWTNKAEPVGKQDILKVLLPLGHWTWVLGTARQLCEVVSVGGVFSVFPAHLLALRSSSHLQTHAPKVAHLRGGEAPAHSPRFFPKMFKGGLFGPRRIVASIELKQVRALMTTITNET